MPTLKLIRVPPTDPPAAVAAFPDGRISAAVPDEVVSAAAKSDNASAAVPDQVASSSQPSEPANGGDRKCAEKMKEIYCGVKEVEEPPAKARVRTRAEAAKSNGDGRIVGIKIPTGNKYVAKWSLRYCELMEYKQKHGNCLVSTHDEANKQLGSWVRNQRTQYRLLQQGMKSLMTTERIDKLEKIGFVWDASLLEGRQVDNIKWNCRYRELVEYKQKHGHCKVSFNYDPNKQLWNWVRTQRRQYCLLQQGRKSWMTEERIAKLEEIGFEWRLHGRITCIL
jgi:hypothetical protein